MSTRAQILRTISSAAVVLAFSACEASPVLEPSANAALGKASAKQQIESSTEEVLKQVRQATSRFHSTTQAQKAGYGVEHQCVAVPGLGGMGQHWVNMDLVDPVFDPEQPEVLLYAPGPNGKPQLVAVEYIVIDAGQGQPSFGAQPFDVGGTPVPVSHWSLHVWVFETNPSGTFAPFNPNVECN